MPFEQRQVKQAGICHLFDNLFCLFSVLRHAKYPVSYIVTGSWKDKGNHYIQLIKVLLCKLWTNGKQLHVSAFLHEVRLGFELCHGESTRNSRFVDMNVRGPKARVHLYYESTVPSAFSDLKYCLMV